VSYLGNMKIQACIKRLPSCAEAKSRAEPLEKLGCKSAQKAVGPMSSSEFLQVSPPPLQAPSVVCYWDQLAKQCTAAAAQRMYTILAQEIIMLLSDMQMSH
jgi:hypothetical protein